MTSPEARLVLIVAMASDKDHMAFAREFLSGSVLRYFALCFILTLFGSGFRSTFILKNVFEEKSSDQQ